MVIYYKSSSPFIFIPFLIRSSAVIPRPLIDFPENVQSDIFEQLQDGE